MKHHLIDAVALESCHIINDSGGSSPVEAMHVPAISLPPRVLKMMVNVLDHEILQGLSIVVFFLSLPCSCPSGTGLISPKHVFLKIKLADLALIFLLFFKLINY